MRLWKESTGWFRQGALQWVLDFPLFYKILIANSILVLAAMGAGSWLGTRHFAAGLGHGVHWEFVLPFSVIALVSIVLVNYGILRAALQPMAKLTRLIEALRRGDIQARAEKPLFGDPTSNALIQTANRLLDELEAYRRRVSDLSKRITQQVETERRNIARELHDETTQNLAALLILEEMIGKAATPEERSRTIEEAKQLTRLTLEGVRRLSIGLRPPILDDAGVPGALKWYVEEVLGNLLPRVQLDLDTSLGRLTPVAELALYRIAQEALSNVSRHAQASTVTVSLKRQGQEVVLSIADDGVGFDPSAPWLHRKDHLGLFTIMERARLAEGHAEIISKPGAGTTVVVRLPLTGQPSSPQDM